MRHLSFACCEYSLLCCSKSITAGSEGWFKQIFTQEMGIRTLVWLLSSLLPHSRRSFAAEHSGTIFHVDVPGLWVDFNLYQSVPPSSSFSLNPLFLWCPSSPSFFPRHVPFPQKSKAHANLALTFSGWVPVLGIHAAR